MNEDLEAWRVPRQLEEPHNTNDGEELENVGLVDGRAAFLHQKIDVEGQRGHKVNDVDGGLTEDALVGRHYEAYQYFEGEPGVTGTLNVEEGHMRLGTPLVQRP